MKAMTKKNNLWKKVPSKNVVTGVVAWENCLEIPEGIIDLMNKDCLLYTSPSPRDRTRSRMPSSA